MYTEERYSRQIMLPEIGTEGQRRVAQAKVLVVGVGGLGSPISIYLTAAGVGTIGLIDDDQVSLSNLQRQILYGEDQQGKSKMECARERLNGLNSEVRIVTHPGRLTAANAAEVIGQYDIVVDGCDNYTTRYLINDTCKAAGKPYVYGAIKGFHGQVSVFNYRGGPDYRSLYPDEAGMVALPATINGVIGVTPAITGTVQASETLKIILETGEVLSGKLWIIDLLTMQSQLISL